MNDPTINIITPRVPARVTQRFLEAWHENGRAGFGYDDLDYDSYARKTAKDRRRYIACDVGTSGAYLIDRNTGDVYSIKAYGKPNRLIAPVEALTRAYRDATARGVELPRPGSAWADATLHRAAAEAMATMTDADNADGDELAAASNILDAKRAAKTGAHLRVRRMGDAVMGVDLLGDRRHPEPEHFRVTFPGGDVDIARRDDGLYWVHVRIDRADDGACLLDGKPAGRFYDARIDRTGAHAAETDAGDFGKPGTYHVAVLVGPDGKAVDNDGD